jgi:hypothetical protein
MAEACPSVRGLDILALRPDLLRRTREVVLTKRFCHVIITVCLYNLHYSTSLVRLGPTQALLLPAARMPR